MYCMCYMWICIVWMCMWQKLPCEDNKLSLVFYILGNMFDFMNLISPSLWKRQYVREAYQCWQYVFALMVKQTIAKPLIHRSSRGKYPWKVNKSHLIDGSQSLLIMLRWLHKGNYLSKWAQAGHKSNLGFY